MTRATLIGAVAGAVLILAGLLNAIAGMIEKPLSWILPALGACLVLVYAIIHRDTVRRMLSLRSVRYGGNTLAVAVMLLVILGLVNFLFSRHSLRFDTSAGKQFSLSEQTRNILKNLKKDVTVTGFFRSDNQRSISDLLQSYRFQSKRFHYEFVDPDKKPALAKRYGIENYGIMILECQGKEEKVSSSEEQEITNALIKVTREGKKSICFLEGHGENAIDDEERAGYSRVKKSIEDENYEVRKLSLAVEKSVPADCAILVVAGSRKEPFPSELDSIQAYLERGGKALFLLDPDPSFGFASFLAKWNVQVANDVVLDVSGVGQLFGMGPSVPLVTTYENHDITRQFRLMTFYPYVRSVASKTGDVPGVTVESLLKTSPNSWAETDLTHEEARFDQGKDTQGPISLGVVVTKFGTGTGSESGRKTRIVVFGDSDFANNSYFDVQGNRDFFMNTVSWLAEEEDLISIRAKNPEDRRIALTAKQAKWVMVLTVIFMPLVALGTGIGVYIRKERR